MGETKVSVDSTILLKGVRLSFSDLFVATQFEGKGPFSYGATVLVETGSENDKMIQAAITRVAHAKWEKKAPEIMKTIVGQSGKCCYIDGNQKAYDGYAGKWALTSKRPKDSGPPKVVDRNPTVVLTGEEGRIYSGCYVNIKVSLWAQDNDFGKAIRSSLVSLQFKEDGESFGGAPQSNTDGFENEESDSSEFE